MSLRILWQSVVFLVTLALIYLAFPILIVPSSLPAIQTMLQPTISSNQNDSDLEIYQLTVPVIPTAKDKLQLIISLHRQGMDKILNR